MLCPCLPLNVKVYLNFLYELTKQLIVTTVIYQLQIHQYRQTETFINFANNKTNMKQETITIPKEEYKRLKKLEKIDWELVQSFKNSMEDLKDGRIRRVK